MPELKNKMNEANRVSIEKMKNNTGIIWELFEF